MGIPNSWMVFVRENPINTENDWGLFSFQETTISRIYQIAGWQAKTRHESNDSMGMLTTTDVQSVTAYLLKTFQASSV